MAANVVWKILAANFLEVVRPENSRGGDNSTDSCFESVPPSGAVGTVSAVFTTLKLLEWS